MRRDIKVDDAFFDDLKKIDGPKLDHWRITLIIRLHDFAGGYDLPKRRWHGTFRDSDVSPIHLSSVQWHPSGVREAKMQIWHLYDMSAYTILFAEHENTLGRGNALDIALSRAELIGCARSTFAELPKEL